MSILDQLAAIENLESRLAARIAQVYDLATMGTVVTSILEIDAVLSVTMEMALRLVDGEVGLILLQEEGELRPSISWGVGEGFVKSLMYEDDLDLATYCHTKRESVILADLELKSDEGIVLDTVIACPIGTKQECLGVIVIINKASGGNFIDDDREMLNTLMNFVAVAVENSALVKDQLRQQKVAQEMAIASQIQATILPQNIADIPGATIGAAYFPAQEVGGDFYEVLKISDHEFMVIIGDVSNKGVPAALVMSACAAIIKTTLTDNPAISPSALAERVNTLMADQIIKDREMFVTLFFSKFNLQEQVLTFSNAGHIPGLFWDDSDGKIIQLADGGPILGQFSGIPYKQGSRKLRSGDRLFLFTDGLTEAMDADGNLFGRERAEQVLSAERGSSPDEFCHRVKEWVDRFAQGSAEDSHDDFTILQVKVD